MVPRPPSEQPQVRPLDPAGASSVDRSTGPILALIAGVAGLVIGFVLGGVVAEDPEPGPSTSNAPTSSTAPRGLVSGAPPVTSTAPTMPPDTTSTTLGPIGPDPTLGEMVPGFQWVLTYSLGDPDRRIGRWSERATEPTEIELPTGAIQADWDASGSWVATIARSNLGDTLYLGPASNMRPAFIGAEAFAWHDGAPERLAFTSGSPAEGEPVELYVGDVTSTGFSFEFVSATETDFVASPLVEWGEWGYALFGRGSNGATQITTLGPDGRELATRQDVFLVDTRPDGTLLIVELYDEPDPETGNVFAFVTTDATLTGDRVSWDFDGVPVWSHNGKLLAGVSFDGFAPAMAIHTGDDSFEVLLDVDDAFVLGWTPDDRFVIAWTPRTLTRDGFRAALLFVDLIDRSVNAVPVEGVVTAIGFEL